MQYNLFNNGVDSLKRAHDCIEKIPELKYGIEHNLKDAILSLNHSFETLFKYILKGENEFLIFSKLEEYLTAKEKMLKDGKNNVFDAKPNLNTIGLIEAIRRLRLLCDYKIDDRLIKAIVYLIGLRNKLQHYELVISEGEMKDLSEKLKSCYELGIEFLSEHLSDLDEAIEEARFEETHEDYWSDMAADHAYEQHREDQLMYGED